MAKTLLGAGLAFGAVASAVVACSSDHYVDDGAFCVNNPTDRDCAGRSGSGGAGGASGMGGAPMNGTGGAPMSGMGGGGFGGSGGGGTCIEDLNCNAVGEGSLCVNTVCTAPATTCALGTLVVVDKAFSGDVVGAPLGACYFRSLDEAVAKVAPGTTKVLSVYAAAAGAKAPLDVTGLTFEGHGTTTSQPVTLTVTPAGTAPLVRLGEGSVVRGFALSGPAGQAGLGIETGKAQLAGPLTLAGLSPALSVGGNASVTVVGAAAAPVRLSGNARGIVVGTGASLEMTGEGGESLVLEGTTGGAGVLVEKGQPDQGELKLTRALVRNNQGSNPTNGSGGVEVRGGRKATVSTNTFTTNNTGITFQGSTGDLFDAFKDVTLAGNDLSNTLPAGGGTGVAICGSSLNADGTTLTVVGTDNQFPTPASCAQLAASAQPSDCNLGTNLGLTGSLNKFGVDCVP